MTKGLSAAGCIPHHKTRIVWASDAVLADTFDRFCNPRRHGSSVPGPLEAQRRAAKRKNTSLAHSSHGGISADPSIVLESTSKVDWWQAPVDLRSNPAASRLLPEWLFPFSTAPTKPARDRTNSPPYGTKLMQPYMKTSKTPTQLQLSGCQNMPDIRQWLREQGIDLRENPKVRAAIQRRIQKMYFGAADIASYICDPIFHPPGTSFILELLSTMLDRTWEVESWKVVSRSVFDATELGLVSIDDLKTILTKVADVSEMKLRDSSNHLKLVRHHEKSRLVHGILESVARCRVLRLADFGSAFLSELFSKLASFPDFKRRNSMLWDLIPWARESNAPVITELTVKHLRNRGSDDSHERLGQNLAERLANLETAVLRLVLLQTTERLVRIARDKPWSVYRYLFYHWTGTLAVLGTQKENIWLEPLDWDRQLPPDRTISPDQRLALWAWNSMYLGQNWRTSDKLSHRLNFLTYFEKAIMSTPKSGTKGFLERAIVSIDGLPLPNKHLLRNLVSFIARTPTVSTHGSSPKLGIGALILRQLSLQEDDKWPDVTHMEYRDAVTELVESFNQNLALFKVLSRKMIHKSATSFDFICAILESNTPFKLALSRVFSRECKAVSGDQSPGNVSLEISMNSKGHADPSRNIFNLATPKEAVDLINHLAVSFATSNATTPRASLRRVYWCYVFLHRYGGPIQPIIAQALWHVGVERYGDDGTAATLLKWILGRVREVEGEGVARQLLWSESFREKRRHGLEALSKVEDDEEKALLAELGKATLATATGEGTGEQGTFSSRSSMSEFSNETAIEDLDVWRKIRFARLELDERLFWFDKSTRRSLWESASAEAKQRHELRRGYRKSKEHGI